MLRISRDWATPLTAGVFLLMSVTGLLMFFHLDSEVQKTLHEWAGWLMVTGVALHATANLAGLKRYLANRHRGPVLVLGFAAVVALSFAFRGGEDEEEQASPPALAIGALLRAPLTQVAPLFGKTPAQARSELAAAGIVLARDDAALADAVAGDRGRVSQALRVLARKP